MQREDRSRSATAHRAFGKTSIAQIATFSLVLWTPRPSVCRVDAYYLDRNYPASYAWFNRPNESIIGEARTVTTISLTVNGKAVSADVEDRTLLV
ncbi:MAG: hypothetical protein ACREDP_14120, partial [Bradyrhizobium sp.]